MTAESTESGGHLNIPHLREYWERSLNPEGASGETRDMDTTLLSGLRLGLLETLQFLHTRRPSFEEFEAWIVERNGGMMDEAALDRLRRALRGEVVGPETSLDRVEGLSADDLRHWDEHGYVVLRVAVSKANAEAAELAIYEYLGMRRDDPESWYSNPQGHSIWVSLLRHPAIWVNRRSPRIAKAFAQLWGREDLWVNVDQGGLNPTVRPDWPFPRPHLHWDTSLAKPHHFGVQGILYSVDVAENQGAFCCIPGLDRSDGAVEPFRLAGRVF